MGTERGLRGGGGLEDHPRSLERPALREIGNLLPNNQRQRRTCYALCHILYPVSAAHTSIFRMDSNSTSYHALRSDPQFVVFSLMDCEALRGPRQEGNGGRGVRRPHLVSRARQKRLAVFAGVRPTEMWPLVATVLREGRVCTPRSGSDAAAGANTRRYGDLSTYRGRLGRLLGKIQGSQVAREAHVRAKCFFQP